MAIPKKTTPDVGKSLTDITAQNPAVNSNVTAGVTNAPISSKGLEIRQGIYDRAQANKATNNGAFNLNSLNSLWQQTWNKVDTFATPIPWSANTPTDVNGDTAVWQAYAQAVRDQSTFNKGLSDISSGGNTFEDNLARQQKLNVLKNTVQQQQQQYASREKMAGEQAGAEAAKQQIESINQFKKQQLDVELEQSKRNLAESQKNFINKQNSQLTSIIQTGGGGAAKDMSVLSQAQGLYMQGTKTLEDMYMTNKENAELAQASFETNANNALNNFLSSHSNQAIRAVGMIDALKKNGKLYTAKGIQEANQILLNNSVAMSSIIEQYGNAIKTNTEMLKLKADNSYRDRQLAENARQFNISSGQSAQRMAQDAQQYQSSQEQSRRDKLLSEWYIDENQYMNWFASTVENSGNVDFSSNKAIQEKYKNNASFKNNNPSGMTWGISDRLKNLFNEAGIKYEIGSARPSNEGGNYIKFNSVKDGMNAHFIALTNWGSNDIESRLKQWVWTNNAQTNQAYADSIMQEAGIPKGTKFSELTGKQYTALTETQLKRESGNFLKEVQSAVWDTTDTQWDVTGDFSNLNPTQLLALKEYDPADKNSRVSMNMNFKGMSSEEKNKLANEYKSFAESPEVMNYVSEAISLKPATETDSPKAKAALEARAMKYMQSGMTAQEAKYAMVGSTLKDKNATPILENLVSRANTLGITDAKKTGFIKAVTEELNKGNEEGAFTTVELKWVEKLKTIGWMNKQNPSFESSVRSMLTIDKLMQKLSDPTVTKYLGKYAWNANLVTENWVPNAKIPKDKDGVAIKQTIGEINTLFMNLRKEISGSAVTESESKANEATLIDSTKIQTGNPEATKAVLQTLFSSIMNSTQNARSSVWLPPFTNEAQLRGYIDTDKKNRGSVLYDMYLWQN